MDGIEFKELFKVLMQSGIISIGTSWKREYI